MTKTTQTAKQQIDEHEYEIHCKENVISDLEDEIEELNERIDNLKSVAEKQDSKAKERALKRLNTISDALLDIIARSATLEEAKRRLLWLTDDIKRMISEVEQESL